jgi:hypothetical protein
LAQPELTEEPQNELTLDKVMLQLAERVEMDPADIDRVEIRKASPAEAMCRIYPRNSDDYESHYITL